MDRAFARYRIMSYVTGTTLLILSGMFILNHVDLAAWKSIKILVEIVGIGHGVVLYPIYVVMSGAFALKARTPIWLLLLMLASGFVPGLAFYMEHVVAHRYGYDRSKETAA
jgi:integral membrane protein